jgi:FkbM family methyltransferase
MSPAFAAWPAAFDFNAFDAHRVELYGGPSVGTASGRRFVDADSIVAWSVDVYRDVVPSLVCADASLFTASLGISLEGNDDDWDKAALLGCPSRPWLGDALRAHTGKPFRAVFVGANKGYGLASLLSILAPSLKVSPATWGVSLRNLNARLACGWCRDCLEDGEEWDDDVSSMIEVDLVEPLRANVGLLAGCLRHHGFVEKDVWTKGPATVRLLPLALGRTKGRATFPSLAAGEEVGEVCSEGTCDVSQFAGRFESEPRFEEVRVETLDGIIDGVVDYLSLDVEGHDPLVLDGGIETVKNARLVEFEYHFRGAWC